MAAKFDDQITPNLEKIINKVPFAIQMYLNTRASTIKSEMKVDRPWTDRTNMAKARLDAKSSMVGDNIGRITLSHGVWYGIYLELAHEKKYAVIKPTIDKNEPKIISEISDIFSDLI